MTPQQFVEQYTELECTGEEGEEKTGPLHALLDDSWVNVGRDAHATEIVSHIRTLPLVGHWNGCTVRAYDGGKYVFMFDTGWSDGYWAIPRSAIEMLEAVI